MCSSVGEQKHKVEESEAEYKFVERLIPPSRVPTPPKRDGPAPSGWTPPAGKNRHVTTNWFKVKKKKKTGEMMDVMYVIDDLGWLQGLICGNL